LESDAPALGPIQNEVNHPNNILISAQEIAKIKKVSIEIVQEITTQNAQKLFKRLKH
jgi:TatD DNase family protein